MTRVANHLIILAIVTGLTACQSDGDVRETANNTAIEETTPEVLTTGKAEGKIVEVTNDHIILDNNTTINLPVVGSDTTTIYMTIGAEKMEGKAALSETGLAWAGHLATVFQHANILQAYSDKDNTSMQTANLTAQANQCELNFFNSKNTALMMSTIISNFKGRRVLLVVKPETASAILAQLEDNPKLRVPPTSYENLFVILAKEDGTPAIRHVLY